MAKANGTILIDFSQIAQAVIHMNKEEFQKEFRANFLNHILLNSIRLVTAKFKSEYGNIVICCDSRDGYWRTQLFEHYKGKRKEKRKEDDMDWEKIHAWMEAFKEDLRENFPYKVVEVSKAEADDIIGHLATRADEDNPTLIYSGDHDFAQCQKNPFVQQYDPRSEDFLIDDDPALSLKIKIIKGDSGDGIPNIVSPSNTIMREGVRQTVMSKKRLDVCLTETLTGFAEATPAELLAITKAKAKVDKDNAATVELNESLPEDEQKPLKIYSPPLFGKDKENRYRMNKLLIDLSNTPKPIRDLIDQTYDEAEVAPRAQMLRYLSDNDMTILMGCINDF